MTIYSQAESNTRKTWLYLAGFLALAVLVGWAASYYFNNYIVLIIALVYSLGTSFLGYWYSDKIVLSLAGAKLTERKDNLELYRSVENLCITAGLPLPKIYIIPSAQPNAFATGRNPANSAIAFTTGILGKLEKQELEGVIAHELSHIGNRDALLQTIVVVVAGVLAVLANFFYRIRFYGSFGKSRDNRDSGGLIMILGIVLIIVAPLLANLAKLAISRKREFLADASGALLTRYPDGLARALEKISTDSSPLGSASSATSHLYIVSPLKGKEAMGWFSKIMSTHPPVEERIKALKEMSF